MILAILLLLLLQFQYWWGDNGRADQSALLSKIQEQQVINERQTNINKVLKADVDDLKVGLEAVEEHARLDLGLIKPNETFVLISTSPEAVREFENQKIDEYLLPEDAIEPIPQDFTDAEKADEDVDGNAKNADKADNVTNATNVMDDTDVDDTQSIQNNVESVKSAQQTNHVSIAQVDETNDAESQ